MYRYTITMMMSALVLAILPAHAALQPARSVVVSYADLDLSRSNGATVLYRRIRSAAETVCATLNDRNLGVHAHFEACVQSAIGAAVAEVNRSTLTAYYGATTNGRNAVIQLAQK